jgi:hypothetical protein
MVIHSRNKFIIAVTGIIIGIGLITIGSLLIIRRRHGNQ